MTRSKFELVDGRLKVQVIEHDHISKEQETCRPSCFVECSAHEFTKVVSAKDRQSMISDKSDVENRRVLRDEKSMSHEETLLFVR